MTSNQQVHSTARSLAALLIPVLLAGCGGGGSNGADTGSQPNPGAAALNAGNYQAAAQAALSSMVFIGNTNSLAAGASPATPKAVTVAAEQVRRIAALGPKPLALGSLDIPCEGGTGKINIVTNDANSNSKFDAGDSLTLQADACKSGPSLLQGRIVLTLRELVGGDYGARSASARLDVALNGFAVIEGSNSSMGEGRLTVGVDASPSGTTTRTLEVPTLALTGRLAGNSYSHTLSAGAFTQREEDMLDGGGSRTATTIGATLTSTALAGQTVRIETNPAFLTLGSNTYPGSGRMLIQGSGGSQVRVTALNVAQAQIEFDANGDGTFEASVTKNWSALLQGG